MFDEYKNNSEYLRIAERCNESLQNANISEEDRESIYLTTYAFLNSVAKEYHLNDIENKIYDIDLCNEVLIKFGLKPLENLSD